MRGRVLSLCAVLAAGPALASMPVPRIMTGCVADGVLTNTAGYAIRVRVRLAAPDLDLSPYDGRRVRVTGHLLPGDVLVLTRPVTVIGRCQP